MSLPKSIQRQAEQVQAYEAALAQQAQQATVVVNDPSELLAQTAPAPETPVVSEAPAPVESPAPAPQPQPQKEKSADYWEQRFKTVSGMQQAELAQVRTQVKELTELASTLKKELAEAKKPAPAAPEKAALDPKDVEAFGADLMDAVNRHVERSGSMLMNQVQQIVATLEGRVSAIEEQVTGVTKSSEEQRQQQFMTTLSALVPDWREINSDPDWLEWLDQVDPIYGAPRQAALDAAHQRLNAQHVASVFNAFKDSKPKVKPKQAESLEKHVAPSGVSNPTPVPTQQAAKPILTEKFIHNFYSDLRRGAYVGRDQERQRIEAEINSAVAEGRIR